MKIGMAIVGLLALAGCAASGPTTPQQRCQAASYDDPTVKQLQAIAAGTDDWLWQHGDKLKIAREQAVARCLAGQGGPQARHRGGVEAPR